MHISRIISRCPVNRTLSSAATNTAVQEAQADTRLDSLKRLTVQTDVVNQIKVVSSNTNNYNHRSPLARISITFRAGSRFESASTIGASHFLRRCAGLKSNLGTSFLGTRTAQQYGIAAFCRADRETISAVVTASPRFACEAMCCLKHAFTEPLYLPWEVSAMRHLIMADVNHLDDVGICLNLLHGAAFRRGLGHSLYCPAHRWKHIGPETLHEYHQSRCRASECTVAGLNVDHDTLKTFAQSLVLSTSENEEPDIQSPFLGGECRQPTDSPWCHVAIAGAGSSSSSLSESVALAVLQQAWGSGPATECTSVMRNDAGVLASAVRAACPDSLFRCSAINCSYSDAGLFGFQLSTEAPCIAKALDAAMGAMRAGKPISDEHMAIGKQKLKAAILLELESEQRWLDEIGGQTSLLGQVVSLQDTLGAVDAVSSCDVENSLDKCMGKLSMSVVGNVNAVPYLDELEGCKQ